MRRFFTNFSTHRGFTKNRYHHRIGRKKIRRMVYSDPEKLIGRPIMAFFYFCSSRFLQKLTPRPRPVWAMEMSKFSWILPLKNDMHFLVFFVFFMGPASWVYVSIRTYLYVAYAYAYCVSMQLSSYCFWMKVYYHTECLVSDQKSYYQIEHLVLDR